MIKREVNKDGDAQSSKCTCQRRWDTLKDEDEDERKDETRGWVKAKMEMKVETMLR